MKLDQKRWAFHFYRHLQPPASPGVCPGIATGDRVSTEPCCGSGSSSDLMAAGQACGRGTRLPVGVSCRSCHSRFWLTLSTCPGLCKSFHSIFTFCPRCHPCFRAGDVLAERGRSSHVQRGQRHGFEAPDSWCQGTLLSGGFCLWSGTPTGPALGWGSGLPSRKHQSRKTPQGALTLHSDASDASQHDFVFSNVV